MVAKTDRPVDSSGTFLLGDLPVHRMGFGAMRITGPGIWGPPEDHDEAIRVLRRAVELGVDFIDTANSYGPYVSEELICEALYPYPDGLVIGTKAGLTRIGPDPAEWPPVGRPEYLRQECLMSLRRLRLERIDLFQLHRIDAKVPAAEQFGVLKELRDEGKVRHVGLSEVTVAEIEAAQAVVPIVSVQNLYNLANRRSEQVLDHCESGDRVHPVVPHRRRDAVAPARRRWPRSPRRSGPPLPRWLWRGCCAARPSCFPSREPRRWLIWRRTAQHPRWCCPTRSSTP